MSMSMLSLSQLDSLSKKATPPTHHYNDMFRDDDSGIFAPPVAPLSIKTGGGGKVELGVEEYLRLLQMEKVKPILPPQSFFISKASYVGSAKENYIQLNVTLEVAVLVDTWNKIKLLPDSVGLSSHSIKSLSPPSDENPRIGVMDGGYFLITQGQSELIVSLSVLVPYSSARRSGMYLWVPRAAENQISFTVGASDIEIKVDPSFVSDENKNKEKDKEETVVNTLFPPTNTLSVNWTIKIDEGPSETKEAPKVQKMMITAEHSTMCSIGEGIVLMTSIFNYSIVHGSASTFDIQIPDDFNLLAIEGNGIKKWEVMGGKDENKRALIHSGDEKYFPRCLRVILDYGLEDAYRMTISELAMSGTSADVAIPSFRCLGEEINREKGYLAVEARTNVEIAELKREYLGLVDTSELPANLVQLASNPILMGYKFLNSGYFLELRVKKHDDVGVLVAACDEAHFITTFSEEGKILHKLVLQIRNSQKQYVRVKIPTAHELWSATVAGQPVKPASDEEGMVMIQLQKSGANKKNNANNVFIVELVYIEEEDKPMNLAGTLNVHFAQLDIPINYLFVSVHLPPDFTYSDFTGTLREVEYFNKNPPKSTSNSNQNEYYQPQMQVQSNSMASNSNPMYYPQESMQTRSSRKESTKGVLPVKVEMPVSGREFKFEQLIVMGGGLMVSTHYKKNKKTNRRAKRSCC